MQIPFTCHSILPRNNYRPAPELTIEAFLEEFSYRRDDLEDSEIDSDGGQEGGEWWEEEG
jgi:hypothetical protein